MKSQPRTPPELQQLGELIEDFDVAMLTTADAEGVLGSRPMTPLEMDSHGAMWFFTDLRSAKIDQLRAANLAFVDAPRGRFISVAGRGEIDTNREHIERLWSPMMRPWFPGGPESPDLVLLRFVPHMAEYWDAPSSKMVRMFALAASVVTGKPVGRGENHKLSLDVS